MNSKNKIYFFLLPFFLHHLNSYINIKTIAVYFSRIIPNQITEILIYIDIDIYTEIVWTLSQAMAENEYTKREKTGEVRFIYKTFIRLETIINKFERFSHNLIENKKEAGMSDK